MAPGFGEWSERLSVGIEAVDAEHRLQISLVKALEDALAKGGAGAGAILQQLLDFTNAHFVAEELLMRLHAYPGYEGHVLEHGRLLDQLDRVRSHCVEGKHAATWELVSGVRHWLVEHMQTMDAAFAAYAANEGAAP
jgi:hemerythrin